MVLPETEVKPATWEETPRASTSTTTGPFTPAGALWKCAPVTVPKGSVELIAQSNWLLTVSNAPPPVPVNPAAFTGTSFSPESETE